MLGEYVDQYVEAYKVGDEKTMRSIERDLGMVGMDKYSLMLVAGEKIKEETA